MSGLDRATIGVRVDLRSLTRDRFTIAVLFLMPIVSIRLYGLSVGSIAELGLFETQASLTTVGMATGAVFASGALAGILGMFGSLGVRTADRRLVISGYRRFELAAARFATVVVTAILVAVVTTSSLDVAVSGGLESFAVTLFGLSVAGVLFGLLGVLVGSVLPRALEGSLVLVALADVSAIVASGLFGIGDTLTHLFPLSHPQAIVLQATVEGSVATAHVLPALGYLGVVTSLAVSVYALRLPSGSDSVGLREFRRTPVLVALLLVLPAYFVGAFVLLVPDVDVPLRLGATTTTVSMTAFAAAFMTAVSVAILSGIVGLFLMQASEAADDRLRLAGYSGLELVLARVLTLGTGVTVVSAVAVGVAVQVFAPASVWGFTALTGVLGITYGVVGVSVGPLFDRLGGVYVMLLVPLVDVLLFQNPLASGVPWWADYLPGHHATAALFEVAFTGSVEPGTVLGAVGYAAVLTGASVAVFSRTSAVE
jgi:hypothetical protein